MADKKIALYYDSDDDYRIERTLLKEANIQNVEFVIFGKDFLRYNTQAFLEKCRNVDGAIIQCLKVTEDILRQMPNLRIMALHAIGCDHVDLDAATRHRVAVTNAPGFCTEEAAMHTIGLALDLIRGITIQNRAVREGIWNPMGNGFAKRLSELTVGLIFFGSIPQYMAPVLNAFRLKVISWAPTKSKEYLMSFGVEKAETLDVLLSRSDIVSLHTPLVNTATPACPSTVHLMGEKEFSRMKNTAFFVNTARGACVDEKALISALRDGEIAGAAVDVIENEKEFDSELIQLENCIVTPHSAWFSEDAFSNVRKLALQMVVEYLLAEKTPRFLANPKVMDI